MATEDHGFDRFVEIVASRRGIDVRRAEGEHIMTYLERIRPVSTAMSIARRRTLLEEYFEARRRMMDPTSSDYRRAMHLLKEVCGSRLAGQVRRRQRMTVSAQGYHFELRPGRTTRCLDPEGRFVELCVQTVGRRCHPLDEVLVFYMHIRCRLRTFLKTACVVLGDLGFDPHLAEDRTVDVQAERTFSRFRRRRGQQRGA